jgi:hypothetical protein
MTHQPAQAGNIWNAAPHIEAYKRDPRRVQLFSERSRLDKGNNLIVELRLG